MLCYVMLCYVMLCYVMCEFFKKNVDSKKERRFAKMHKKPLYSLMLQVSVSQRGWYRPPPPPPGGVRRALGGAVSNIFERGALSCSCGAFG